MRQWRILLTQMQYALQHGFVVEPAHQDLNGNWKRTPQVTGNCGGDLLKVAAAFIEDYASSTLVVVTVMD